MAFCHSCNFLTVSNMPAIVCLFIYFSSRPPSPAACSLSFFIQFFDLFLYLASHFHSMSQCGSLPFLPLCCVSDCPSTRPLAAPGAHFAEVVAVDPSHPQRGALFRVPVSGCRQSSYAERNQIVARQKPEYFSNRTFLKLKETQNKSKTVSSASARLFLSFVNIGIL
jgi:hypothetical protein